MIMNDSEDFMVRIDLTSIKAECDDVVDVDVDMEAANESRPFSCERCSETFDSSQARDLHVIELHDNVRAKVRESLETSLYCA